MALNPQYQEIAKGFIQQYYLLFDDPNQRQNLIHLYSVSTFIHWRIHTFRMNFIRATND